MALPIGETPIMSKKEGANNERTDEDKKA